MKTTFVSVTAFILMTLVCAAQDSQPATYGPGWFMSTNLVETNSDPTYYTYTANPTYPGGSSAIAEAITPEISALAASLQNSPTLIYNYVHDQIQYVHYFGSHKGAAMTLLERSGNDFDQCALLVALLRAAGYSTNYHYQFGMVEFPYSATNQEDYQHWLGTSMPNTNWPATTQLFADLNANAGFPYSSTFAGETNDLLFHHVWVVMTLNGTTYALDPSFKVYQPEGGSNLDTAAGISTNTLLTDVAVGATATADYVQGLNEANLRNDLKNCATNLVDYIESSAPNATVQEVIGGQTMVPVSGQPLPQQTVFTVETLGGQWPVSTWQYIPTGLMAVYGLVIPGTTTYSNWFYLPALEGGKLSLVCNSNGVAQLYLENTPLASVQTTGTGSTFTPTISIQHPYGNNKNWSFTLPGLSPRSTESDQSVSTQPYQRTNATYVLLYGLDANQAWMTARQQQLDSYIQQGYSASSRQVMSETLNVMGLSWLAQTELMTQTFAGQTSTLLHHHHRLGRMAQETGNGYYVDVYESVLGDMSDASTNVSYAIDQAFELTTYFESAFEHGIVEQMQNSNILGASTVKLLELASTNNEKIYLATTLNWTAGADVSGNISSYNTNSLYSAYINEGYSLLLPQNGAIQIAGAGTWTGSAFVALKFGTVGASTMSMVISPGGYGGYSSTIYPPDPAVITTIDINDPTYFDPQSPTLQIPAQLGADPVNLVDGSFQITSTDLSLGQTEPRGLNLTRYYSSARRNSNLAGMAPGWVHSYYCTAIPESAWQAGLGGTTPQQCAPIMVAARAALDVYNNGQGSPKNSMTLALIAKWGIDQLINNAVSINLGNQTLQFVKQPNGSYTGPANCTMALTQNNGAYVLQERHGRTFKFSTGSVLTNISDQYGQSMKLSYNSNNLVTNVTDWTNRSLVFQYSGTILTNVLDSAGRSVSYGYSGGELTSYTDPEQKTTSYTYDTNNDVTSIDDALDRLIVTNYYDGYGHITTQLTEGDTNKAWQVAASGYQTIEVDPAGDTLVYTYDAKSRLIAFQDGMGHVTQTAYDGQDHLIQTISALNETNQYIYDGNDDLIETIDPLGYSNVFTYDSNFNLIASTDANHNTSHYGYNTEFSPTGVTNGNGDWFVLAYNPNGTLQSRTDSAGTTSYGYDSYGTVNSITYPSPLGGESFVNSALGDPTSHTDANGNTTTFAYNNRRQLTNTIAPTNVTTKATFDANANLSTTTDARNYLTSNNWSVTRMLLSATMPATPQGTPGITNIYDNRDWLAATQNPLGYTTYYTNDAAHRPIASTDPLQRPTLLGYDNDNHPTTAQDAAGDLTSQFYNSRGNMIKVVDAATDTVNKGYDGGGNLIYLTNRNEKVWSFQYDGANRLTNATSPLNHTSSRIYNNRGLLQSSTDALNRTTTFGYDARGRLSSQADGTGTATNHLDLNGNLTNLTENGQTIQQAFDVYNRLSSYTDANGYNIQYRRDANGNITNLIYPGNLSVKYYYDSNDRLTNITDWSSRQTAINYDLAGHITTISRPNNTVRSLGYDNDGELTNIVEQTTSKYPICFYTINYNAAGRVQWEFKGPSPHSNAVPARTMTYDNDNRLYTFNGTNATVDNAGNLTYSPGTNNAFGTYSYDPRNRLTNAQGILYGYDPANDRTFLTNGSTVSVFVTEPQSSQVLMRITGNVTNYYIYGPGLLYEIDVTPAGTAMAFYHYDCRGSTIALTDANGNPTDLIEYSSYGTTTYRYGTNSTPFLFNGQFGVQTDPNGLLYMRARYYNPYICRFLNPDPSGFNGGLNFYAFCDDNPVSNEDPFGLQVPGLANLVMGFGNYNWPVVSDAQWNSQFQAVNQQALAIEGTVAAGAVVGAAGATVVGASAVGLVSVGVPQSVVSGGLLLTGGAGLVASGYSIYNNPSINNIAFNAGGLGGGLLVGNVSANYVASALSPPGYQPSGASIASLAWKDANGNINPLAFLADWLLPGAKVGPMSTGPDTSGATGTVTGAGAGVAGATDWLGNPLTSSSTGKH